MKFIELLLRLDAIHDLKIVGVSREVRRKRGGEKATLLGATAGRLEKIQHIDLVELRLFNLLREAFRGVLAILVCIRPC